MSQPQSPPTETARKPARRIPPLVWIVIALLLAWFIIATLQRSGTHRTPQGGTMPQAAEGPATLPAAPAAPGAPATPGGVVEPSPQQQ